MEGNKWYVKTGHHVDGCNKHEPGHVFNLKWQVRSDPTGRWMVQIVAGIRPFRNWTHFLDESP